ncbi:unnamed protein product [Absidia cylindrospora]
MAFSDMAGGGADCSTGANPMSQMLNNLVKINLCKGIASTLQLDPLDHNKG